MEGTRQYLSLEIPNMEVKYIYENTITAWFDRKIRAAELSQVYSALENGDKVGENLLFRKRCCIVEENDSSPQRVMQTGRQDGEGL